MEARENGPAPPAHLERTGSGQSDACCHSAPLRGFAILVVISFMVLHNIASWGEASLEASEDANTLPERLFKVESSQAMLENRIKVLEALTYGQDLNSQDVATPTHPPSQKVAEAEKASSTDEAFEDGNQRLQEPEATAQVDMDADEEGIEGQRTIEQSPPRSTNLRSSGGEACKLKALEALKSKKVMEKAGWLLGLTDFEFKASGFTAWRSNVEVGSIKATMPEAGWARFLLRNDFELQVPDNVVRAFLNDDVLVELQALEEQWVCVAVQAGDTLLIREEYGKIRLQDVGMKCDTNPAGRPSPAAPSEVCRTGTKARVLMPGGPCTKAFAGVGAWVKGEVVEVFSSSRATVRLTSGGGTSGMPERTWQQILPPTRLFMFDSVKGPSCQSYRFQKTRYDVGIITLADKKFREVYKTQMKTLQCYGKTHGYAVLNLDASNFVKCNRFRSNFFFMKHCVVAEFLRQQEGDYIAVVLDADVVAAVLDRGMDRWLTNAPDLQFYERVWNDEVAAGNYIARNTPFAQHFLMRWAEFMTQQPRGYASADNGAIHLHLIETLNLPGAATCRQLYTALEADVRNLDPYFRFVKCAKQVLGPPRRWSLASGAELTVWPRLQFFVVDGFFINFFASGFLGPLFHHGVKDESKVKDMYYSDVSKCKIKSSRLKQPEEFGRSVLSIVRDYKDLYPQGRGCPQCIDDCMPSFTCRPLRSDEEPKPKLTPGCAGCKQVFNVSTFRYTLEGWR